ncbi:acidic repeat-containing protein isoform X1 [Drosophila simulans]|uniref:acidic repeat-containing protein isoform X1 n=1 Tax=Drosophila simulans TaxID=7240 RepID=UPI00192CE8B0|nr:acidic repeat-containing protein isoform X1 [Drosophila simulans]XP_039149919.1 acidic repeat-containing protein isoform X1 [Drosophila simulans]XP_039149920.1 acidic repeat-containing protein isoform X1 [Drosophila simulans]XP_044778979.1 acidic repeat-containing protein isoform X1 [Drosophila simulans]
MKFVILLCVLSALLLQIEASPLQRLSRSERAVSRQQTVNNEVAPAVAPASDDDDDDDDEDDDDEPDLGDLIDDDDVLLISGLSDDDEEEDDDEDEEDDTPQGQAAPAATASDDDEEEDDDDDDYLDRLFDDILGDDEDEDDDDETPAATAQQSAVAAAPAQNLDEVAPAAASSVSAGISDGVDLPAESGNAAEVLAAGNAADESVSAAVAPAQNAAASSSNNEGIAGDDDEEADDDDDDDDDDIIGDDIIEARREARDLKNNVIDMSTDAFQARHNHFIDAIFSRINRIVSENYDPYVVNLTGRSALPNAASGSNVKAANKKQSTSSKVGGHKKLKNTRSEPRSGNSNQEAREAAVKLQEQLTQLQSELAIKAVEKRPNPTSPATESESDSGSPKAETRTVSGPKTGQKKSSNKQNTKKASGLKSGNYNQPAGVSKAGASSNGAVEKLQKAEGRLSGLASLKRVGNVKVISDAEGRNSTIKAKFTLGPLVLRVEKSFKKGSVRSVKSATARTNEMMGRIKFSVLDDRATLMSIKVQQPKQVEVESKDNHDRTREFVWRRTPKIAKLVNEKLKLAAESLFAPQGVEVVRL